MALLSLQSNVQSAYFVHIILIVLWFLKLNSVYPFIMSPPTLVILFLDQKLDVHGGRSSVSFHNELCVWV